MAPRLKKCAPGVFCIENITLVVLLGFLAVIAFLAYQYITTKQSLKTDPPKTLIISSNSVPKDRMSDPYYPPMKDPHVPVEGRGGIPTRSQNVGDDMILPLMGRRSMTGRDKWQYYTMSNTGNLSTKLPLSVNGKSCTSEYGCDDIMNGDNVFVEGYNDSFRVTKYENNLFQYIPAL
jgi:hypothetical protein